MICNHLVLEIADGVDDNSPTLVDKIVVGKELEFDLADYLKDYKVRDFVHLVDCMDD
jgi:hypothetical protein